MPLSERFRRALDTITTVPHAEPGNEHSTVWSQPGDLANATGLFRRLWEDGERAEQDEIWEYLEKCGVSGKNCSKIQDAWMTVNYSLSKVVSRLTYPG